MMYWIFVLAESLALANFNVAFSSPPLMYRSPKANQFPGGSMDDGLVNLEDDVFWQHTFEPVGEAAFPDLGGMLTPNKNDPGRNDKIDNTLSRKGSDKRAKNGGNWSNLEGQTLDKTDDGRVESPVVRATLMHDPVPQMVLIPNLERKASVQGGRRQTIKSENKALGLAERELWRGVGKDWKKSASGSFSAKPFQFREPERDWYSFIGQPPLPVAMFREPIWDDDDVMQEAEEQQFVVSNPTLLLRDPVEQMLNTQKVGEGSVIQGQLSRERLGALIEKQLNLGWPGATKLHFPSGIGESVSKNRNSHHPEQEAAKSFFTIVVALPDLFSASESLFLGEMGNGGVEDGKLAHEMGTENGEEDIYILVQNLEGPGQIQSLPRIAQKQDDVTLEKVYLLQSAGNELSANALGNFGKETHEVRSDGGDEQKSQATVRGVATNQVEVHVLLGDPDGISGYKHVPERNETEEPTNEENLEDNNERDRHNEGPEKMTFHLGDVEITMGDDGEISIHSLQQQDESDSSPDAPGMDEGKPKLIDSKDIDMTADIEGNDL